MRGDLTRTTRPGTLGLRWSRERLGLGRSFRRKRHRLANNALVGVAPAMTTPTRSGAPREVGELLVDTVPEMCERTISAV